MASQQIKRFPPKGWVHMGIFGTTGEGKSTLAEKIMEMEYLNRNSKIIGLQNNLFLEDIGFAIPTREKVFIDAIGDINKGYTWRGKLLKPMGLPTEIYHPIVPGLPSNLPDMIKLYTLPVDFFADEDILRVISGDTIGDSAVTSICQEIDGISDRDSLPALPVKISENVDRKVLKTYGMEKAVPMFFHYDSSTSVSSANRPFLKVKNLGIFSSRNFKHCLTDKKIIKILRDNKTITGFSTKWIAQRNYKLKLAINLYLLKKIREFANKTKENCDVIVYIREARQIFPNAKDSDKSKKVLASTAEDMIRDCRKAKIHLILDTQTPKDMPDAVLDQVGLRAIFKHDMKMSTIREIYGGSPSLDTTRVKGIKRLGRFKYYLSYSGFPVYSNPIRGLSVSYKLSGHLEAKGDELKEIDRFVPGMKWYSPDNHIEELKMEWYETSKRYSPQLEAFFRKETEKNVAKKIGLNYSSLLLLKYLANLDDDDFAFRDIVSGTIMNEGSISNALRFLKNKGFIMKDEGRGNYSVLPELKEFYVKNIKIISEEEP